MNFFPPGCHLVKSQAGMVLLLCLLFLTALTLLGLSASSDSILQSKLAANLQDTERANQSSRAALSWAEDWLLGLEGPSPEPCSLSCEGLMLHTRGDLLPNPEFEPLSWWQARGNEAGIDPLSGNRLVTLAAGSAEPPTWIIEEAHEIPASADGTTAMQTWYRILARGTGQSDTSISVVESTISRYWPVDENDSSRGGQRVSWRQLR